jgi:hypothetical protein
VRWHVPSLWLVNLVECVLPVLYEVRSSPLSLLFAPTPLLFSLMFSLFPNSCSTPGSTTVSLTHYVDDQPVEGYTLWQSNSYLACYDTVNFLDAEAFPIHLGDVSTPAECLARCSGYATADLVNCGAFYLSLILMS